MTQATFIEIPTEALTDVLATAGFTDITATLPRSRWGHIGERVFARDHHKLPNVQVRVYTSIDRITNRVRDIDLDRIVISAVYTAGKKAGHDRKARARFLFNAKGVNRSSGEAVHAVAVKSILDRMLTRMREVYGKINKVEKCPTCGEPVKTATSRKRYLTRTRRGSARKANPNFKRPYKSCMAEECSYFEWTGPLVDADGAPAGSVPANVAPVFTAPVSHGNPATGEGYKPGFERLKPESIESETFESTDGTIYHKPNTEPDFESCSNYKSEDPEDLDDHNARIAAHRAKLDADASTEPVDNFDRIAEHRAELEAKLDAAPESSSVDDARAMFSRP